MRARTHSRSPHGGISMQRVSWLALHPKKRGLKIDPARAEQKKLVVARVKKADRIVVIDQVRWVEHGIHTHTKVMALGGLYAGLAALQFNA